MQDNTICLDYIEDIDEFLSYQVQKAGMSRDCMITNLV